MEVNDIIKLHYKNRKQGFTLIELVTVITILGLLVLLAVPNLLDSTRSVSGKEILNNIRVVEFNLGMQKIMTEGKITEGLREVDPSDIQSAYTEKRFFNANGYAHVNYLEGFLDLSGTEVVEGINGSIKGQFVLNEGAVYFIADKSVNVAMDFVEDTEPPIITIGSYSTQSTNQDVTICATTNEGYLNNSCYTFTENGTFKFIATDIAGNKSIKEVVVDFIDKTPPVITIASYNTDPTNQDITVHASLDDGAFITPDSHTFISNGSFTFIARDAFGNESSATVVISNIDKVPPANPIINSVVESGIGSININYSPDSQIKQYKINDSEWMDYAGVITLDYNATIYARAADIAGNHTSIVSADIIVDDTPPSIMFTMNGNSAPAKSRSTIITVQDLQSGVDEPTLQYVWSISTTEPVDGWAAFVSGDNLSKSDVTGSYYLYVRAADTVGNATTVRSEAFVIDNTMPIVTFGTNGNAVVAKTHSTTVAVTDNIAVSSRQYVWSTTTTTPSTGWQPFVSGTTISTPLATGNYYLHVKVSDTAGNIRNQVSNPFNIDNTPPIITIGSYTTAWTNSDVKVPAITNEGTLNVVGGYTFTENGSFIFIATDEAGNTTSETVIITNIDKTAPTITFSPSGNTTEKSSHSASAAVVDSGSGVASIRYAFVTASTPPLPTSSSWNPYTNGQTVSTPTSVGSYYLHIDATDNAGNKIIATSNTFSVNPLYVFSKYNVNTTHYYLNSTQEYVYGWTYVYPSFSYSASTKKFTLTGTRTKNYTGGYVMYDSTVVAYVYSYGCDYCGNGDPDDNEEWQRVARYIIYPTPIESRGSLVSTTIGTSTEYPLNGKHTDGYWYVRGSLAN